MTSLTRFFEHPIARGAIAGAGATVPMSVVMLALDQRQLKDPSPTPPHQITIETLQALGLERQIAEPTCRALTTVNHFAYGAAMGSLFGAFCGSRASLPVVQGLAFGMAVWAGSYLGWLPAFQSQAAADRQSPHRKAVMVLAHVVWGASLGYFYDQATSASEHGSKERNDLASEA